MSSKREQVLTTLFSTLRAVPGAAVKRSEALPSSLPAGGLIILRDGDPGEPDVTLNPRTEFYSHRAEIEAFVTQPIGGGEAVLDALLVEIGTALATDRSLGGLAENLFWSAPETSVLAIEGAAPILTARISITIEYLVSDPLAACFSPQPGDPTVPKVRAYGADSTLKACRETAYGVAPTNGYRSLNFKSCDLSAEQPLGDDPLLGRGRNAQDPYRGLITDEGRAEIPLDLRGSGFWLTGLFGNPTVTQTKASGYVAFSSQPPANSTITLNGVAWTFVTGTPGGNQTLDRC